jgi:hypothetical protein
MGGEECSRTPYFGAPLSTLASEFAQREAIPLTQKLGGSMKKSVLVAAAALTADVYDPKSEPRKYDVALPFSRTVNLTPKSGDLFQIVGVGKGNAQPVAELR